MEGKMCSCPHHKVMPIGIILIGLVVLAGQLGWVTMSFVGVAWPILLILIGIGKWMGGSCKCDMK
jgi:hypothetical protein